MKIYTVGGAVRDELLGREVHDRDYVVLGTSQEEFLARFPQAKKVGKKGIVCIYKGEEYTFSHDQDIYTDLDKRDLTINAIAKDEAGNIFAHPLALDDLQKGIIRQIKDENFYQDPLRVIRAARMAACLPNFEFHPDLEILLKSIRPEYLEDISAERVGNEARKACDCARPGSFIKILFKTDNLSLWFREISFVERLEPKINLMDRLAGNPIQVWMALCHDLDKTGTNRNYNEQSGQVLGAGAVRELGQRLRLPNRFIQAGIIAVKWSEQAFRYESLEPETKVDLLIALYAKGLLIDMFSLINALRGVNLKDRALLDLQRILTVKLPDKDRNQGKRSGELLRQLRAKALKD